MKKVLNLVLVLGLGLFLVSGCNQGTTSSGGGTTVSIPAATIADSVGSSAMLALSIDNSLLGVFGVTSASSARASAPTTPTYEADGWWISTNSYSASGVTHEATYYFKVWTAGGEVTTLTGLAAITSSTIAKLQTYTTWTTTISTVSYTMKYGASKSDPLTFDGYNTASSQSIDGPISYTSTYTGETYQIVIDYVTLTLNSSGYPTGSVNWTVSVGGSAVYAGTITYDGTTTATITFTTGATGTYTVNLLTGVVTAAS
ncbi:MAG: hypothetical protein KKA31_03540, partial [Candidatus Margulisbacteria bacterium]|nr:hypothetical protein [Candidatus Margulisiibacteriota bacterium]